MKIQRKIAEWAAKCCPRPKPDDAILDLVKMSTASVRAFCKPAAQELSTSTGNRLPFTQFHLIFTNGCVTIHTVARSGMKIFCQKIPF
jgi:hypothetical protein